MSRREENQSRYDQRSRSIFWTIEWQFHSKNAVLLDHGVHDNTNIYCAIEKHLKTGPWMHPLKQFCEEEYHSPNFFIRKYPKGHKLPFLKLDIEAPVRQQLANVVILEYPVIYISLPSHSHHFEVVKEVRSVAKTAETLNITNNIPSPKGVTFKEEEIKEANDPPEPQGFDAMNQVKVSPTHKMPCHDVEEKSSDKSSVDPLLGKAARDDTSYVGCSSAELGNFDDFEFDIDQGLIDAYSDMMTGINPDDFLDFEGIFAKEVEVEEKKDITQPMGVALIEEELEEGEIAE